jgi:type I restriction enzyme S subunit
MRWAVASVTKRQVRLDINPKLMNNMMARIRVCVPPHEEQKSIGAYLEKIVADSDAAVSRVRRELALVREYRTRLVADVVTGKLDVRAAAARLPEDETDASEPLDAVAKDAGDGLAEDDALGDEGAREGADETLAALE